MSEKITTLSGKTLHPGDPGFHTHCLVCDRPLHTQESERESDEDAVGVKTERPGWRQPVWVCPQPCVPVWKEQVHKLEAENERLREKVEAWIDSTADLEGVEDELRRENARLREEAA